MITENVIYWITRLDSFHELWNMFNFLLLSSFVLSFGGAVCLVSPWDKWNECDDESKTLSRKLGKLSVILFSVFLLSITAKSFLPTTKEMCIIKIVPKILQHDFTKEQLSKDAQLVYGQAIRAISEKLEDKKEKQK